MKGSKKVDERTGGVHERKRENPSEDTQTQDDQKV